jgi:uncharacterized protein
MNNVQISLLQKARRALRVARVTREIGDGDAAVDRAYYAMIYAATAALASVGESPKTHHGTRLRFHLHFVRSGRLEKSVGQMLSRGHRLRLRSDSDPNVLLDGHATSRLSAEAERFVNSVEKMLCAGMRGHPLELAGGFDVIRKVNGSVVSRSSSVAQETSLPPDPHLATLTRREREVLDLLVEGRTSPQIAEALFVAPSTVCFHVRNIYEKMQVHTRGQAVARAIGRRVPEKNSRKTV